MVSLLELSERFQSPMTVQIEKPITFETFLDITDEDDDWELVDGKLVSRMTAQWTHEDLYAWLFAVMRSYASNRKLGIVGGSRTPVRISDLQGRAPDLFFLRQERRAILQEKAIYGVPDLLIEIISPNDRPAHIRELEADYRQLAVPEIVFIDPQKRNVRVILRQPNGEYMTTTLTVGEWHSAAIAGFHVALTSLFDEPRPDELDTTLTLVAEAERAKPQ